MGKNGKRFRSSQGQSVIELAIFGAILIFLIASIAQQGLSSGLAQNESLQATRQALLKSYQTSRGISQSPLGKNNARVKSAARNVSTFFFIEDRLSSGVTRYGAADRQPYISMASGSLTNKLFWVADWDDLQYDTPFFDLKINGQSFTLKLAVPLVYRVRYRLSDGTVTVKKIKGQTQWEQWFSELAPLFKEGDSLKPDAAKKRKEIEEKLRYLLCTQMVGSEEAPPGDVNPSVGSPADPRMERDIASTHNDDYTMFTVIVANDPRFAGLGIAPPRLDLQRNGDNSAMAYSANFKWKWDWKDANDVMREVDWENANFPSYDVDGDLKEETVYHITKYVHSEDYPAMTPDPFTGNPLTGPGPADWDVCDGERVYDVAVMDYTAGEANSANVETNPKDEPGLKPDTHVYTLVQDGTVLEIREGKEAVGSQQLASSFSSKRQFDIISREYQLNTNMVCDKTLCDSGYGGFSEDPGVVSETVRCKNNGAGGTCCAQGDNLYATCFDMDQKRLYIRSRIDDKRGRLWVIKTNNEPEP